MAEGRAVLVTGSTGGIGTATVGLLRQRGFTVYAGARGRADFGPEVRVLPLDVADPESVAAAAKRVAGEVDGLWAVINNAGVIVQGPLELVPADEWRRQLEVNTIGPASVIREFLPLLRAGGGRIVNVSAATGRVAMPLLSALSASKAGLEAVSNALRLELAPWKIPVVVIEPGTTETEIFTRAGAAADATLQQADPARLKLYRSHLAAYEQAMTRFKPGPVDKVAKTILRAVEARRPKRRYAIAEARTLGAILPSLPAPWRDRLLATATGLNNLKPQAAES
ncbi:SDR family NAD(P)-dependent oxidoreductase [Kribbella sp.]|uniref:SDR family NAD(P)-dependent oxidoreductase n=1 Tax=Kribbella sp. TaxID=1871183 RepID=UPI002D287E0C|nr:SDR family NAD(P)-dependent oxidoreductase [Kribbella sp.]HZX01952.1 SDR family NAD(P)-dependent oxidoreductase [Kribbella sp.]